MFSKVGFLCANILNDTESDIQPCVPVVFPNPGCPHCGDLSFHMEFLLPDTGESVKIDLPVNAARELCDRVLGSDEYDPLEPDNEDDPTLFSYRTSVHVHHSTLKQKLYLCVGECDTYEFRLYNSFWQGVPFQTHETKRVNVIFLEEQILDYCEQIQSYLKLMDMELSEADESEVLEDE